jgi:putative membrane protein
MKKWFGGCLLLSGLLIVGCGSPSSHSQPARDNANANNSGGTTDSRASGYSGNPRGQTPGNTGVSPGGTGAGQTGGVHANADEDHGTTPRTGAVTPGSGDTTSGTAASPREFLTKAYGDSMAEIQLAKLAATHAQNADVKQFAQHMIHDHQQAAEQIQTVAKEQAITLPDHPKLDSKHQQLMERLSNLKGQEFDRAYMTAMVQDHEEDLQKFQQQAKESKDSAVRQLASKMVPTLQQHLTMAQRTARTVSGSGRPE